MFKHVSDLESVLVNFVQSGDDELINFGYILNYDIVIKKLIIIMIRYIPLTRYIDALTKVILRGTKVITYVMPK